MVLIQKSCDDAERDNDWVQYLTTFSADIVRSAVETTIELRGLRPDQIGEEVEV